jgi:hypothetical protein
METETIQKEMIDETTKDNEKLEIGIESLTIQHKYVDLKLLQELD